MLMEKSTRRQIHEALFSDGCLVAAKDYECDHPDIPVKNLYVIKALQSLTSKGYVHTQFSWQYYYYTLTDSGVEYLRNELNIPEGILPLTRLKAAPAERKSSRPAGGMRRNYPRRARE